PSGDSPFNVAVTELTTGIAHTYMSEEALKKQPAEMGVVIKVETNCASGVGNKLNAEDIKNAAGVIIEADKAVDMNRLNS
ncbi:PTS fructose transporter subunit IIB, partial [Streptococcus suis]